MKYKIKIKTFRLRKRKRSDVSAFDLILFVCTVYKCDLVNVNFSKRRQNKMS